MGEGQKRAADIPETFFFCPPTGLQSETVIQQLFCPISCLIIWTFHVFLLVGWMRREQSTCCHEIMGIIKLSNHGNQLLFLEKLTDAVMQKKGLMSQRKVYI